MLSRLRTGALVTALAAASLATPTFTAAAQAAASAKPGLVGGHVVLQDHSVYSGYDVGTDAAGNTYIGWIGDLTTGNTIGRQVYLCTLPPGSSSCLGGTQVISTIDPPSAAGLRVLVTPAGAVTLVWFHEADPQAYAGRDGRVAIATSYRGGPLSGPTDVETVSSNGELYDAELGPNGALWTVTETATDALEVHEGIASAPVDVTPPWGVGYAMLAFSGATPVIVAEKGGAVTVPLQVSHGLGAFHVVAKTWAAANFGLVTTKSGVRLMATHNDAGYLPETARWTGTAFTNPTLTGDKTGCLPSSHDLNTDASGRLVDASDVCGDVQVTDLPGDTVAGLFDFKAGGILDEGSPQIASTPRGHGVVVWSVESSNGSKLMFNRVLLSGALTSVSRLSGKGRVTVTGPISCQPASTIGVSVKGGAAAGWKVAKATLVFGGKTLKAKATIDGSKLKPNKVYTLEGKVVFTKGGVSSTGTETLKFRSCINP